MVTRQQTGSLQLKLPWSPQFNVVSILSSVPTSYTQAIQSSHWREAMIHELNALIQIGTWELVPQQKA